MSDFTRTFGVGVRVAMLMPQGIQQVLPPYVLPLLKFFR